MKKGFLLVIFSLLNITVFVLKAWAFEKPIRIGVASMITPVDAVRYYQEIIDYISAKLHHRVEMVHRRTYEDMDRLLKSGDVDIAFICSAPYVKDRRGFGVELLVAPEVNGRPFYRSYIIVQRDSKYKDFKELKGKTFAFTDPRSNSGKLYPEYLLAKMGTTPEKFFKKYIYSYSHNKSIELVAKKIVDGAAVESLVYEYMKKKGSPYVKQTRIINMSPEFGIPPVVVSPTFSPFLKEKVRQILLSMHKDPEGKKILQAMMIDRFVTVPDSNYDFIRKMETFVAGLKKAHSSNSKKRDDHVIYFGVIPRDNPRILYEKYQPLMDYLTEKTPYRFELVIKKSYVDTVTAVGNGEIDIALMDPLTYLEAHKKYGAVCILKSITAKRESFYRSVIITREDSPIRKLSDLKGRSFAFGSILSTSGNLLPRYMLARAGIHLQDLKEYKNFHSHDSVVKWVLRGRYDAGAVRESVAEKYLPLGIKIIATSSAIPTGPIVVGPKTPYTVVRAVKDALLKISTDGKDYLQKTDPELRGGFIEAEDSDYEGIRRMINDVPQGCGRGCHPEIRL